MRGIYDDLQNLVKGTLESLERCSIKTHRLHMTLVSTSALVTPSFLGNAEPLPIKPRFPDHMTAKMV